MINYIDKFIEVKFATNPNHPHIITYRNLKQDFPENGIPSTKFDKSFYDDLFKKVTTRESFRTRKALINAYLKYLYHCDWIDEDHLNTFNALSYEDFEFKRLGDYYKNIGDVLDTFNNYYYAEMTVQDRPELQESDILKSIVIMGWYGIKLEDMLELKKTDIDCSNHSINVNGDIVIIPEEFFKAIEKFKNNDVILAWKFQDMREIELRESEYFYRSFRKTKMKINSVRASLNHISVRSGRNFTFNAIYDSGLYNRVYQYEIANGKLDEEDKESIAKVLGIYDKAIEVYPLPDKKYGFNRYVKNYYDKYLNYKKFIFES